MNLKDSIVLLLLIVVGCTLANLIALKIAGDQVQKQLDSGLASNPILNLLR